MERVTAWRGELEAVGAWVFTAGLQPPGTATVLRVRDGEALITDSPFAEGKERLLPPARNPGRPAAPGRPGCRSSKLVS
jgi:hypothetical protein